MPKFFENTVAAAKKFGIGHEIWGAADVRRRFPQFKIHNDEVVYYGYDAGFLRPEACVSAQLELARSQGAQLLFNEKVESFSETKGAITVRTNKGQYQAQKLLFTAGPWLPTLLNDKYAEFFKVSRQMLFWFDVESAYEKFTAKQFPIFIWELPDRAQGIYGFPAINGVHGGLKIATEYDNSVTAENVDRHISQEEIRTMYENFVVPYFYEVKSKCIRTVTCLYTMTSDSHFVIDTHPEFSSVLVASPCSGHGFKHSAAIGEALAQLITQGQSVLPLDAFPGKLN